MWDFIIVGAGSAGSVLAHELSADSRRKVLLLEAGGMPTLPVKMPAAFAKLFKSRIDWAFESEPQASCGGRTVFTPRGKMLGGSSNMNAQIHQWGHPADFDGWAKAGARGWAWSDVAPLFRRMESWAGAAADDQRRGALGPMRVENLRDPHPIATAFVAAARHSGLEGPDDYNGGPYEGAWLCQLAHRKGERFSIYDAYLRPAMKRQNLKVVTGVLASRLVFKGARAVGVETLGPQGATVHRGAAIVLCAGAFGTPSILLRSGVGPAAHLAQHGISVVADRAQIGENLQDHPLAPVIFRTRRSDTMKSAQTPVQLLRWLLFRRGLLASNAGEAMAFKAVLADHAPDLELLLGVLEWRNQALEAPRVHGYTIGTIVLTPRSRGTVRLKSAAPDVAPAIDFGLLTDPEGHDARVLLEGARLARRIAATEPLKSETLEELAPGAAVDDDAALLAFLKSEIQTVYHPCGTCRMGRDKAAPVTSDLRLRGVEGVWVADASVMPTVPRGHPNAVIAMIAQRASELILNHAAATRAAEIA